VDAGTPAEAIDNGIGSLVVMGHVICPEPLVGVIQSKVRRTMGHVRPYPPEARLFPSGLDLDRSFVDSLEDGTEIAVIGGLCLTTEVPDDLLQRKIGRLHVYGSCLCREESLAALRSCLVEGPSHLTVLPAGHGLHEGPLTLDRATLATLDRRKLYCTDSVIVESDVSASDIDGHLATLVSEGVILCPAELKEPFGAVCDLLENRVVFYDGELLVFDGDHVLRPSRLEFLEAKATAFVSGSLTIDPEIPAKLLAERFAKIHNAGDIRCTAEQMGAIEARLGLHDGDLAVISDEPDDGDVGLHNANVLTL